MKIINPPKILLNSVYVKGLNQPLETVAEILDEQGKHEYALALRYASEVCQIYSEVNLEKTAQLIP